ncbi:MAG: hypothetical protein AAGC93_17550 [Cyanobacteria bacterium P01_F01_bin.53]
MHTTYRLNANELDESFLEGLKSTFKGREIEIVVSEVDETAYLMQSEANRKRLLTAMENVENRANLVEVSLESLE